MIYLQLFLSFLQIGAFSFGGGYAAMPLIQEQVVTAHHWLSMDTFADLVTIAEMTPGPIAINAATFVGSQTAGLPGSVVASLGCILPSCLFVSFLSWLYAKYRNLPVLKGTLGSLRPAVVAMIARAGLSVLISAFFLNGVVSFAAENISFRMILYFVGAFILLRRTKLSPILIMCLCGVAELVVCLIHF